MKGVPPTFLWGFTGIEGNGVVINVNRVIYIREMGEKHSVVYVDGGQFIELAEDYDDVRSAIEELYEDAKKRG